MAGVLVDNLKKSNTAKMPIDNLWIKIEKPPSTKHLKINRKGYTG